MLYVILMITSIYIYIYIYIYTYSAVWRVDGGRLQYSCTGCLPSSQQPTLQTLTNKQ